jgi:hypothetical protein
MDSSFTIDNLALNPVYPVIPSKMSLGLPKIIIDYCFLLPNDIKSPQRVKGRSFLS